RRPRVRAASGGSRMRLAAYGAKVAVQSSSEPPAMFSRPVGYLRAWLVDRKAPSSITRKDGNPVRTRVALVHGLPATSLIPRTYVFPTWRVTFTATVGLLGLTVRFDGVSRVPVVAST